MRAVGLAGCLLLAVATSAKAGTANPTDGLPLDQAEEYSDCMTLARRVPAQALESGQAWRAKGGGVPAGHCIAVALIGLGRYSQAAQSMEKLAGEEAKSRKDIAAGLYDQAAQAWILAGDDSRAVQDETAALALTPQDPDLLTDRGVTLASMGKYWDALDDFNKAHDLAPGRADILVYRASAYRLLNSLDLARDNADEAIRLQPRDPDAYLERGIIRQLAHDPAGAKEDWQKAVAFGPGTPAAQTAEANLKQLAPAPAQP